MNRTIIIAAALVAGVSGTAFAQSGPPDPYGDATVSRTDALKQATERFDKMDTNHDGNVSAEEMAAAAQGQQGRGGGMGRADANDDGVLSKDEFLTAQSRRFDMMDVDQDSQSTKAERDAFRAEMIKRRQAGG